MYLELMNQLCISESLHLDPSELPSPSLVKFVAKQIQKDQLHFIDLKTMSALQGKDSRKPWPATAYNWHDWYDAILPLFLACNFLSEYVHLHTSDTISAP